MGLTKYFAVPLASASSHGDAPRTHKLSAIQAPMATRLAVVAPFPLFGLSQMKVAWRGRGRQGVHTARATPARR
jgi:hypothetical protein